MRAFRIFLWMIMISFVLTGCAAKKKTQLDYAPIDAFARQVFDTISQQNLDGYLALAVAPEDVDAEGKPLMSGPKTEAWKERHERSFKALLGEIEREGGTATLQWVKPGQAMGYLKSRAEFLGNIYIEVTVGASNKQMVLEIGATQEAKNRGRLLTADSGVHLKTWEYYKVNVL